MRVQRRPCGVVAVELAFILPVMLLMMAGIVEFARAFWYYNALDKATRDAARYMSSVPAYDIVDAGRAAAAVATAKSIAVLEANGANVSPQIAAINVDVKCDGGACGGTRPTDVSAGITGFTFTPGSIFPFVAPSSGTFSSVALDPATTMRYMH